MIKSNSVKAYILLFFIVIACSHHSKNDVRISEAKWMYFESNFMKNGLYCTAPLDKDSVSNICFAKDLEANTRFIGDTLEVFVVVKIKDSIFCRPWTGTVFDVFGFYPKSDTVTYRFGSDSKGKRIPEVDCDSLAELFEANGVYSRRKQKIEFKKFLIANKQKLNPWLYNEAKRKKYFD